MEIPYHLPVDELTQLTTAAPPLCWAAYAALSKNKSNESIFALKELLSNQDWNHVRSAIEAIGNNIHGNQLENVIKPYLQSPNQYIVTTTIKALSNLKSKKAYEEIKALTNSSNVEIKQTAIEGLSNIWNNSDFDFLLDLDKRTTDENIRKSIGFTLAEKTDEGNWKKFFDNYHNDNIARHREWSLSFAGEFSTDKSLIEPFLNDKDGHIRKKAQQFLNH